jgi:hypothetical protein
MESSIAEQAILSAQSNNNGVLGGMNGSLMNGGVLDNVKNENPNLLSSTMIVDGQNDQNQADSNNLNGSGNDPNQINSKSI